MNNGTSFISPSLIPARRARPHRPHTCPTACTANKGKADSQGEGEGEGEGVGDRDKDKDSDGVPPLISRNWREFRAALVKGSVQQHEHEKASAYRTGHWAHPISLPETGCFLASHPAHYLRRVPYLTQSVIFLTSYDRQYGATGLVVNRPLHGSASELETSGLFGRSLRISDTPFRDSPVYIGGPNPAPSGVLQVLHNVPHDSATQPLDGVYVCDLAHYMDKKVNVEGARLFFGCMKWEVGVLEAEVNDGTWYCIGASEQFALKHCINLPVPLWKEIMVAQGGIFEQVALKVYRAQQEEEEEQEQEQEQEQRRKEQKDQEEKDSDSSAPEPNADKTK